MTDAGAQGRPLPDEQKENGIGDLFGQLVDDAEAFVRAEIKLYRAEAIDRLESYKWLFVMGAVGAVLGLGAVILVLMALVFALAPYTGPTAAAAIVAALSLAVAAALFTAIFARIREDRDSPEDPA